MYRRVILLSGLFCYAAAASPLTQIDPTTMGQLGAYLGSTTYVDFSTLTEFNFSTFLPLYPGVGDAHVTVAFSNTGAKQTVPTTWGTEWAGGPPYPEGTTCTGGCSQFSGSPPLPIMWGLLDGNATTPPLTFTLSGDPVTTFGFEVGSSIGDFTAIFHGATPGDNLTITHTFTGYPQSFIFAATGDRILSVSLTTNDTFGPTIGAFRYFDAAAAVPEPTTLALLGAGMLALGAIRRLRAGKAA